MSVYRLLLTVMLAGGAPASGSERSSFTTEAWTIKAGLPQNSITDITQSEDGYLWLTTFGGLARFDGQRFELFDIARVDVMRSNRFTSAYTAPDGDLWFGTESQGLIRLRDNEFDHVPLPKPFGNAEIRDILGDGDTLWIAGGKLGLAEFLNEGDIPSLVEISEITSSALLLDDTGALWVATPTGPRCWSGPCEPPDWPELHVSDLTLDRDGAIWLSHSEGISSIDAPPTDSAPAAFNMTRRAQVALDALTGRLWYTLDGHRLFVRDLDGSVQEVDLPNRHDIRALFVDREGILWVGTDGGGLLKIRERVVDIYGTSAGLLGPSRHNIVADQKGRIWIGGGCLPLQRLEGDHFETLALPNDEKPCIGALAADHDGTIWIGNDTLLYRYQDDTFELWDLSDELDDAWLQSLALDREGVLWLGTSTAGVRSFKDGAITGTWTTEEGLIDDRIVNIVQTSDGAIWFGTRGGASRLKDGAIRNWSQSEGLSAGAVRHVLMDPDGTTWLGTYGGGLTRLKGDQLTRYTRADGLCDNVVSHIADDGQGGLWLSGNRGISRVQRDVLDTIAQGEEVELQCALLESIEGNLGGLTDDDGRFWWPTIQGLAVLDPNRLSPLVAPQVVLESARMDGIRVALTGAEPLPPGRRDLEVHYTGLSFSAPDLIRFRYRLRGYDDDWIDAGSRRVATFTGLPPGRYTIEIEAINAAGIWSEAPATATFELAPRFRETPLFFALVFATLGMALVAGYRLRLRDIREHNATLQREIDERQRVLAALEERERLYRTLFEGAGNGLFVHSVDGALTQVNLTGCALLGTERDALLQRDPMSFVEPTARENYGALIERALNGEHSPGVEGKLLRADGAEVEVYLQSAPFHYRGQLHALITAVDQTETRLAEARRIDLERQLQQSQRLESLGVLAGGIAHDFNNLLTAIMSQACLIEETTSGEALEQSAQLKANVKRAARLTNKLLVFSREQPHSPRPIELNALLQDLAHVLRRLIPADIDIRLSPADAPLWIRADAVQMEQAVINLAVNARDAMPNGGALNLQLQRKELGDEVATRLDVAPGTYAIIEISDNGNGIAPEIRDRIFEPFFTTKGPGDGTGLGLAMVHGALRQIGGAVTLESELDVGSRFLLYLPQVEDVPELEPASEPFSSLSVTANRPSTLLFCDDEESVREITSLLLERRGYKVIQASDPQQAIVLAEEQVPDLLITDVIMPGMSGPDLARRLWERFGDFPVVYISGHTRDTLLARGRFEQEPELLRKPFTADELTRRIEAALSRQSPPQ